MHYLSFELAESGEQVTSFEAMASTGIAQHAAAMAEVRRVLDWAWSSFPDAHGPVDDGNAWDHELQLTTEAGGWHVVSLTVTSSAAFAAAFIARFIDPQAE